MKTVHVALPVLDKTEAGQMLDLVTRIEGVVAALVDSAGMSLEVVVSRHASALHVREQVWGLAHAASTA